MEQEIKSLIGKENYSFLDLCRIVSILRSPEGCPWDRAQTHASLRRYLLEETYEVAEGIDEGDPAALKEELGDLLLQILFHADIEKDLGHFTVEGVISDEAKKMIDRHPHIFGDADTEETLASWEEQKNRKKGRKTLYDKLCSIPLCLPSLLRAQKMMEKGVSYQGNEAVTRMLLKMLEEGEKDVDALACEVLLTVVAFFVKKGVNCEEILSKALTNEKEKAKNQVPSMK